MLSEEAWGISEGIAQVCQGKSGRNGAIVSILAMKPVPAWVSASALLAFLLAASCSVLLFPAAAGARGVVTYLPQAQEPESLAFRPHTLEVAGEGSFIVQRMRWSTWASRLARGRGIGAQDDCEPDCATGTFHRAPARIRLWRPRQRCGHRIWTRMTLTWAHGPPRGLPGESHKRRVVWVLGQFPCAARSGPANSPPTLLADTPLGTSGRIGRLRIDRASRYKVLAVKGEPAAEGWGAVTPGYPDYESLGYSCRASEAPGLFAVGDPRGPYAFCRTVYFIAKDTGRLAALFTSDPTYRGPRGVRPGMRAPKAERRLHRKAEVGCWTGIDLGGRRSRASLLISVEGGRTVIHGRSMFLRGGRIGSFSLESVRHPVGLLFC